MEIFNDPFQIRCHQTETTIYNATPYIGYGYHWKLRKVNSVIKMIYLRIQFCQTKGKRRKSRGKRRSASKIMVMWKLQFYCEIMRYAIYSITCFKIYGGTSASS